MSTQHELAAEAHGLMRSSQRPALTGRYPISGVGSMPQPKTRPGRHVVLSMFKTQRRVGWRCTCGHRLGGMYEADALSTADAHLRWHETQGDTWTQEAGAL